MKKSERSMNFPAPRWQVAQHLVRVLAKEGPATSYELAPKVGLKPSQVARLLVHQRRYGIIEKVGVRENRTNRYPDRRMTPLYAIPDHREREAALGDELPKQRERERRIKVSADDYAWMREQQARAAQKQQLRSRV